MSLISWLIDKAADTLYEVASTLFEWGARIRAVYLIGTFVTPVLWDAASLIKGVVSYLRQGNNHFNSFYYDVMNSFSRLQPVMGFLHWMNAIIDFISNPYPYIRNWVMGLFGYIEWMYYNAYDFIFPHVVRLLDTYFPQWRDLAGWVNGYLNGWVRDWNLFRFDAVRWVYEMLRMYSWNLNQLLQDPDEYIRDKVNQFFPEIRNFFDNPADYIINQLTDRLEIFAERNLSRLVKIAENILNTIF